MNTWIWGPPKWKLLHSLSFSPHVPRYAVQVAEFLNTLKFVLPCIYCRESYGGFVQALNAEWGKGVEAVCADGELALWMYQLHDKVNAKLDTQLAKTQLEEAGVQLVLSPTQEKAVCRKRQITFDCLRKRLLLRPVQFCADDIWEFVTIFALNMDGTKNNAPPNQVQQWRLFFDLLPLMIQISGGKKSLYNTLHNHRRYIYDALAMPGQTTFGAVLLARASYEGVEFNKDYIDYHLELFEYARAHTCAHGSCK